VISEARRITRIKRVDVMLTEDIMKSMDIIMSEDLILKVKRRGMRYDWIWFADDTLQGVWDLNWKRIGYGSEVMHG